jgi:glucose-6-phosphate 1-dehydrogenase
VISGNRSLFTSSAGLAEAFRAFQPLLDNPPALETYEDSSWGPEAADRLTDGIGWQLNASTPKGS